MIRLDLNLTAFDIDGVVADVVTPFLRILKKRYGYDGFSPEDVTSFDFEKALGVPGEVVDAAILEILEHPLEIGSRPYPGAARVLSELCRRTPLLFVTARYDAEPIRKWFNQVLPELPRNRIEIVATGDHTRKGDCLKAYNRVFFIDDHSETCRLLAGAGLKPFVFDQPWNRADRDLPRVRGWEEAGRLLGVE